MRQKELRLALVCYGGISLAVYMHGITKEIWRLARASRAYHAGDPPGDGSEAIYHLLLTDIEAATGIRLRVLADIVAGASAGGINGLFLAQAIATGQSLEPLTRLWLDTADVDRLLAPSGGALAGMARLAGRPLAWAAAGRTGGAIEADVDPAVRGEVKAKLRRFLGAPWFAPPFDGDGFTALLLDAFEAMAAAPCGPPLLPPRQPLDLFVTVTDFHGHPERLRLHSPPEVMETEHRLVIGFSNREGGGLGDAAGLVFAARATASFPGAFPPFSVAELDRVLAARGRPWSDRDGFLARTLPLHAATGAAERAVLIDGSVLANAPFRPAIEALRDRPAAREVDRRFVYIDPKPGIRSVRLTGGQAAPGFFKTIFGALSDIPREQPIRDNLEAIEARSRRIARTRSIVASIRPQVEAAIEEVFGRTFFLDRPTAARLAAWRAKANVAAIRQAGFAQAGYEQLKLAGIIEDLAALLASLAGRETHPVERIADAVAAHLAAIGLIDRATPPDAADHAALVHFLREHDLGFRIRRLRALAARLEEADATSDPTAIEAMRDAIYRTLARYLEREGRDWFDAATALAARRTLLDPGAALAAIAHARDLKPIDDQADAVLADALARLDKAERRALLLAYLGFPFDDIAVLPLLQPVGRDEFNPIRVDRIAPDDATAIRGGGAEATLKGIRFNSFGAFFARAYRENDYLWGRLHGAERLLDILVSTLPAGARLPAGRLASLRRKAFRAILAEERERLTAIPEVIAAITAEIG